MCIIDSFILFIIQCIFGGSLQFCFNCIRNCFHFPNCICLALSCAKHPTPFQLSITSTPPYLPALPPLQPTWLHCIHNFCFLFSLLHFLPSSSFLPSSYDSIAGSHPRIHLILSNLHVTSTTSLTTYLSTLCLVTSS